jgi:hypothetical protein
MSIATCEARRMATMESGSEHYRNVHGGAASPELHGSQVELTDDLEGITISNSNRDYRHNVAYDNARVQYGDQHHHHYERSGDGPDTEHIRNKTTQQWDVLAIPPCFRVVQILLLNISVVGVATLKSSFERISISDADIRAKP